MEKRKIILLIGAGIVVGFINGFFGGGGGMLVVPVLIYVMKSEIKKAHATALLVILPMTVASALTYIFKTDVNFIKALYVAVGTTLGGIIGAIVLKKAKNKVVQLVFLAVMLGSGVYMVL